MIAKRRLRNFPWIASVIDHARLRFERLSIVDQDIFELTFTYYQDESDIGIDVIFSSNDPDPRIMLDDQSNVCDYVSAVLIGEYLDFVDAEDASAADKMFVVEQEVDWVKEGF